MPSSRGGVRCGRWAAARYEPVLLDALSDDPDQQAMFGWFAHLAAYRADFGLKAGDGWAEAGTGIPMARSVSYSSS